MRGLLAVLLMLGLALYLTDHLDIVCATNYYQTQNHKNEKRKYCRISVYGSFEKDDK